MPIIQTSQGLSWDFPYSTNADDYLDEAMDSLSEAGPEAGGTIWVLGNLKIERPIEPRSNVTLDFNEATVQLLRDISFLILNRCRSATVRNARVIPTQSGLPSEPNILFLSNDEGAPEFNTIENITFFLVKPGAPKHTCIHFSNASSKLYHRAQHNVISRIISRKCKTGILIEQVGSGARGDRENHFHNLYFADQQETLIEFRDHPRSVDLPSFNLFNDIKGNAGRVSINSVETPFTRLGIYNVCGTGNHFDHVLMWDWEEGKVVNIDCPDWYISDRAVDTYVCAHAISKLADFGRDSIIGGAPPSTSIPCCVLPSECGESLQETDSPSLDSLHRNGIGRRAGWM